MNPIRNINRSFSARISLYIIGIVSVLFVSAFTIVYVRTANHIKELSIQKAENEIASATTYINREMGYVSKTADVVKEVFRNDSFEHDSLQQIMKNIVKSSEIVMGAGIYFEPDYAQAHKCSEIAYALRKKKNAEVTLYKKPNDFDYYTRSWYSQPKASQKPMWTNPFMAEMGLGTLICTYSTPILDRQGRFVGVVVLDVTLDWLRLICNNYKTYPNSTAMILDRVGKYIVDTHDDQHTNQSYFEYALSQPDSAIMLENGYAMIEGRAGYSECLVNNEPSYVFYRPIESVGWSMALVNYTADIFSDLRLTLQQVATCGALALVLMFVLCIFIIRRISKPIVSFAAAAKEIAHGKFDTALPRIRTKDEMRQLYNSFVYLRKELERYIASLSQTLQSKEKIESELRIAHSIQMGMIPKTFPPFPNRTDVDLYAVLNPAKEVGGDLYDFFIKDNSLYFTIGDVSGKGVPASLVMALSRSLFRNISYHESSPRAIVESMNDTISENNERNMFITLFVGILDLETHQLRFCNAGHNPPCIVDAHSQSVEFLQVEKNLPVGIFQGYVFKEQSVTVNADKTIFLYTDGLTEAENADSQLFGNDRMIASLSQNSPDNSTKAMIDNMIASVNEYVKNAPQSDDLTMLAIRQLKPEETFSITLKNKVAEIDTLADFLAASGEKIGLAPALVASINVCLEEAVSNIIFYAFPNADEQHEIDLTMTKQGNLLTFVLCDEGKPFDPTKQPEADITLAAEDREIGGLGIFLYRKIMTSVTYARTNNKNVLTMTKEI